MAKQPLTRHDWRFTNRPYPSLEIKLVSPRPNCGDGRPTFGYACEAPAAGARLGHSGAVVERPSEDEYLRIVERLANDVVDRALDEGWLMYLPDDSEQTPLQRSINELARNLRHVHYEGDGCLDEDEA